MAAGFTTVFAQHLQDATGTPITNALISFQPVSSLGIPIGFKTGGVNGATCAEAVTTLVTLGAFSLVLADTALTSPVNIGYAVTVIDLLTGDSLLGPGYGCIQPTGTAWSLDEYQPDLPAQATVQYGPPGAPGAPGSIYGTVLQQVPSGTIDGTNITFTAAGTPAIPMLFKNGVLLTEGQDYTFQLNSTTSTITFAVAAVPVPADSLNFVGISSTAPTAQGSGSSSVPVSSIPMSDMATGSTWGLTVVNGTLELQPGSSSSGSTAQSVQLTDAATGQVRTLTVVNGTLEIS